MRPSSFVTRRLDRRVAHLPPRLRWAVGATRLILREPADGMDRAAVRTRRLLTGARPDWHDYAAEPDGHRRLHERLGLSWPCDVTDEFEQLWPEIVEFVRRQGLRVGRGAYGGWDDADPGLARALWCLVRHLHPQKVVETGVARGLTSRVILEALERTGQGHLWSIDLPATDRVLQAQIGIAVPTQLRARWTFLRGTSRRLLEPLLAEIRPIDLFIHDSSHTNRNVRFELEQASAAIERGVIVADDIQQTTAFGTFARSLPREAWIVAEADDAGALFGIALRNGYATVSTNRPGT